MGAAERRLGRREFLALASAAAGAYALAACAPPATGSPAPTAGGQARKGGTLTWGQTLDNATLDPPLTTQAAQTDVNRNIFDSLVALDSDANIYPWIATKWTVDDNSKRYTFTLREDVTFHDGAKLDAIAVKRTFERMADPRTKAAQVATAFGPVDKIDAPDARTVVMTFKDSNPLLLLQLWKAWYGIISPKELDKLQPGDILKTPIGSGPFRFVGRSADGVISLERNPDYKWGSEITTNRATSWLDAIKYRRIQEPSTRLATLESGENILIDDLPDADFSRLKNDPRYRFLQVGRKGPGYGFQFNTKKAPASDLAVRQAVNWAVDRQAIVDKILFGVHRPCVGLLTEGVWGRLEELEKAIPLSGDKKRAGDILDQAGWRVGSGGIREKGGQKLSLVLANVANTYPQSDLADALQLQMREVGIDIQVQHMPINNWLDFTRSYKHDMCDTAGSNFDPDELRQRYQTSSIGSVNYANVSDSQLDEMFIKGRNAPLFSEERKKIYADIQRRLWDIQPAVALITVVKTTAMSSKFHPAKIDASGLNAYPQLDSWLDA